MYPNKNIRKPNEVQSNSFVQKLKEKCTLQQKQKYVFLICLRTGEAEGIFLPFLWSGAAF